MSATSPEQNHLLPLAEVADRLAVSERMARRIITERRVPVVKVGRHVRVWSDDLAAYIAANTEQGSR